MKPILYRQGDVLLQRITKLPSTAKKQKHKGPLILALGEVTGHSHAINKGKVSLYHDPETQCSYVEVAEAMALLTHEEHAAIPLEPGLYQVSIQREYSPEEIRNVAD